MSEKRTSQSAADLEQTQQRTNPAPQPVRRRLLKGSVAIPVIMTLHSGAALARTSNLASGVDVGEAFTIKNDLNQEQIVCAHPDENQDQSDAPPYDFGDVPTATLGDGSLTLNQQAEICQNNGGIMISATAASSLAAKGGMIE
jgi:hypothetical protein